MNASHHSGAGGAPARDPVCGMTPAPDTPHRTLHADEEVLFCSAACKAKFEAEPANYWKRPAATHAGAKLAHAKWTCPMHPEIIRDGPGACPICGMALEPMLPRAESGPDLELIDMTRLFWVGAALALPVLALEMGRHLLGIDRLVPRP